MTLSVTVAVAITALASYVFIQRATRPVVSPTIIVAPFLFAPWVGALVLTGRNLPHAESLLWIQTGFLLLMSLAYAAKVPRAQPSRAPDEDAAGLFEGRPGKWTKPTYHALLIVSILFILITAFHFLRTGIPILATDPELARWNFTASGFFGIPGRVYNLGLVYVYVLAACCRGSVPRGSIIATKYGRLQIALAAAVSLTRVLGGFKGELLAFFVVIIAAELVQGRGRSRRALRQDRRAVLVSSLLLAGAIGYAFVAGLSYRSTEYLAQQNDITWPERFFDRATGMGAEPGRIAVADKAEGRTLLDGSVSINDFRFSLSRYVPGFSYDQANFNTILSAQISGRRAVIASASAEQYFVVPVTPGLPAYVFYDFGEIGVSLLALGLGLVFGFSSDGVRYLSVSRKFIWLVVLFSMKDTILKGNPWHEIFNTPIAAAGTIGLVFFLSTVLRRSGTRSSPLSGPPVVSVGRVRDHQPGRGGQ